MHGKIVMLSLVRHKPNNSLSIWGARKPTLFRIGLDHSIGLSTYTRKDGHISMLWLIVLLLAYYFWFSQRPQILWKVDRRGEGRGRKRGTEEKFLEVWELSDGPFEVSMVANIGLNDKQLVISDWWMAKWRIQSLFDQLGFNYEGKKWSLFTSL